MAALALLVSCKKEDGTSVNVSEFKSNVEAGTWKVSHFEEDGEDQTYHFNGYSFTFNGDGTVVATNGTNTYNGTWSIDEDSNDDSPSNDDDFNINFNVSKENEFDELNDDWDIVSYSSSTIELKDVSGGDGSVDKVTFIKE